MPAKRKAKVDRTLCVSCGACARVCPRGAIDLFRGLYARIIIDKCVGCALCVKACPASVIALFHPEEATQ